MNTDKGIVEVETEESPIEKEAVAEEAKSDTSHDTERNNNNNRKRKKDEEVGERTIKDSFDDDDETIMSPRRKNRGKRNKTSTSSPNKKKTISNQKNQENAAAADDDDDNDNDAASASSGASLSVSPQKEEDPDSSFSTLPPPPPPPRSIDKLRLEAIFHPKFENEKQQNGNNDGTRALMKERIQEGQGYLEVSLKHSGSLLLWSGGQRFYSKNSTSNVFTHVGEILLRQHFCRAHWNNNSDSLKKSKSSSTTTSSGGGGDDDASSYQECSDYVQQHRLTLSFEVVTAVLGDHGATPRRDFLILTAIASRAEERFYTTPELLKCAHRFGLPHNDAWVFSSPQSVDALFAFYDAQRETALATGVIETLSEMAETHVESMYPHVDFQGDILEGIVIRYVNIRKSGKEEEEEETLSRMKRLSKASHDWAVAVPPSLADCYDLTTTSSQQSFPLLLRTNVRAIFQETHLKKNQGSTAGPQQSFPGRILDVLNQSSSSSQQGDQGERRKTQRLNNKSQNSLDICELAKEYLATASASNNKDDIIMDTETQRIATLICSLVRLNCRVDYSVIWEQIQHCSTTSDDNAKKNTIRWLCIIHVFHDSSFQKFRRSMKAGDMALFRGFVVEIGGPGDDSISSLNGSLPAEGRMLLENGVNAATNGVDEDDPDGGSLMLKMKFLPYMVRTFGVRNGMSILRREGKEAYLKYTRNILSKWKMSKRAKQTWMPFFAAWADYAKPRMEKKLASEPDFPVLAESNYLTHLERFRELYESGQLGPITNGIDSENKPAGSASSFRGLLVVVAVQRKTSDRVADWFAKELGDATRNRNLNRISSDQMDAFCTRGSGVVCSATVDDGVSRIRGLLKEHEGHISLLFYGLSDDDATAALKEDEQGEGKKQRILGIIKGWRKTKAGCVVELESSSLFQDVADTKPTDKVREALSMFEKVSEAVVADDDDDDGKPLGVLVFFPGIPGSGKSSLSCPEMEEKVRTALSNNTTKRELIVRMGDKTKKKYWPLVKQERLKDTSGVYIADKNLPSTTWDMVAKLCCETSSVAVPVVPDAAALQTTAITGHRKPSGEVVGSEVHVYPFSLHYLAVCMMRAFSRPQGSHPGKLDGSAKLACMIVIKFFTLYRRMTAEEFMDDMESAFSRSGALLSNTPIEVPFFAKAQLDALPRQLEDLLVEALQAQRGYDISKKDTLRGSDKYMEDLEERLRHCLRKNKDLLSGMTADMATSQSRFLSQLSERVSEVDSGAYAAVEFDAPKSFIKLASIDVLVNDVHSLLRDMVTDPRLLTLTKQLAGDATIDKVLQGVDCTDTRFIRQTHVTMDHFKSASQGAMQASFGALVGETVQLSVTALLWSKTVAALEVQLPPKTTNDHELPKSENAFSHITIWCEKGTSAVASNELPGLVENGEAQQVSFDKPVSLTGTVALWTM